MVEIKTRAVRFLKANVVVKCSLIRSAQLANRFNVLIRSKPMDAHLNATPCYLLSIMQS